MAFQMSLTSVISQQLRGLLEQVCQDYHLDAAEVLPRYLEAEVLPAAPKAPPKAPKAPRQPKAPKEERPMCSHMVKGQPCKHKAQVGDDLCHIHKRQRDNPKPEKEPKRPCRGTTSKGAPCSVKAQDGCDLCHLHMAKEGRPERVIPVKKPRKAQAPQVEGRGSPPPVFCMPCLDTPAETPAAATEPEDLDDQMDDLQKRLAAIMLGSEPLEAEPYHPSKEALEAQGYSDDPDDFDETQMESPHSQRSLEQMKAFDMSMDSEEFLEE